MVTRRGDFRRRLTGEYAADLLQRAHGRVLIKLPVGVRKSHWLGETITHILSNTTTYDAVLVLVPRRDILDEILGGLSPNLEPTVLRPRPSHRCGERDAAWKEYESNQCGQLGRVELCGNCPLRADCDWPEQYGTALRGKRLVFGTQQHLINDSHFVGACKP